MTKLIHTITEADVGLFAIKLPPCPHCNDIKVLAIGSALGQVQTIDIGKRVFLSHGVVQVESNKQRDNRISRFNPTYSH